MENANLTNNVQYCNVETVQDRTEVCINHWYEVPYGLSIGLVPKWVTLNGVMAVILHYSI